MRRADFQGLQSGRYSLYIYIVNTCLASHPSIFTYLYFLKDNLGPSVLTECEDLSRHGRLCADAGLSGRSASPR